MFTNTTYIPKKEKSNNSNATPLHIDTDPLGISFYEKGSTHAIVAPVGLNGQTQPQLSPPFPSPSSSTSSITTTDNKSKSFPSRAASISRSKCQLKRTQSLQSPTRVSAKSWEGIKSPAASFLAGFAFSPVVSTPQQPQQSPVEDEQEGDEIDDYVLDKIIGYGGFSTVRKGFRVSDGRKVAIKIIKKQLDGGDDYHLERELSIWRTLDHANIVCLQKVLETDNATFLICDYCANGNLLDKLKKPMKEEEARTIFKQLCIAVSYLHEEAKICHKDLKLENILIDQDNKVKVCDFGLAICQQPVKVINTNLPLSPEIIQDLECAAGSLAYAAPEQIKSAKAMTCPSTDIWSLGIILYALVTGKLPFHDDYDLRLQQKILQGQYEMPEHISSSLKDLIKGCLQLKPAERLTINQVLQSTWCNNI